MLPVALFLEYSDPSLHVFGESPAQILGLLTATDAFVCDRRAGRRASHLLGLHVTRGGVAHNFLNRSPSKQSRLPARLRLADAPLVVLQRTKSGSPAVSYRVT